MTIFDYSDNEAVGRVASVDTSSVVVAVDDEAQLKTLQVNRLVALRSSHAGQHLIGMISKISRRIVNSTLGAESGEQETLQVENALRATLIGTMLDRHGTVPNVFRRTLETVPEIDARCFVLEGARLTSFMRAISQQLDDAATPLALGNYALDKDAPAWLDGNKFFQRHAIIVGSTGSGKSWTVARLVEQVAALPMANAMLFDLHGEYKPLAGPGIQHLRVAGPSDVAAGRGLDDGVLYLPYWLLTYEEQIAMLLDRSDQNAPNQAMLFARAVREHKQAYLESGHHSDVLANFTIDSPVPFSIADIIATLTAIDTEMVPGARDLKAGPFNGKLTRFIQRLEAKVEDRRMGFLFGGPPALSKYTWLVQLAERLLSASGHSASGGGVKIIDFSEVPSDILPLVIGLVARLTFTIQSWTPSHKRLPVALLCDEAHLYMPESTRGGAVAEAGLQAFERIAKEGRKYGTALLVISQRPADVNRTVLSQCSNFVVMRLTNADDQAVVRRLLPDSLSGFAELLPVLDVGEALVVGDASLLPSRIHISTPAMKPNSGTVAFWDEWARVDAEQDIAAAVEALRRQSSTPGAK